MLLDNITIYTKYLSELIKWYTQQVCYEVVKISGDAIPNLANELKQFFINLLLFPSE